jgi:Protein of unknown function (DUF4231)
VEVLLKAMPNDIYSQSKASSPQIPVESSVRQGKVDYNQQLKQDFYRIIEPLQLEETQKSYLRSRWLDQVLWMEGRATHNRNWHRRLRLTSIVLGVLVPVLVTLDGSDLSIFNLSLKNNLKGPTIVLSSIIAISAAVEEFYQFGNRWYSYRKSSELLKTNGWQFFQKGGQYKSSKSHQEAFPAFVEQIEAIVQRDIEIFVTEGVKEIQKEKSDGESS